MRFEHFSYFRGRQPACDDDLVDALTRLVNLALNGDLHTDLRRILCGGRLVPLLKKDNRIRPLVFWEVLRFIICKVAVRAFTDGLSSLHPLQIGVGGSGPWAQLLW